MTLDISQKVQTDLRDVAGSKSRRQGSLEAVAPRGALPAKRGIGEPPAKQQSEGGGIAAPLTEREDSVGKADRDYHPSESAFYSNNYMLAVVIRPIRQLNMVDADGNEVPLVFAVPGE